MAMSSSPWEWLWNGDEDVATPFLAGAGSRCAHDRALPLRLPLAIAFAIGIGIQSEKPSIVWKRYRFRSCQALDEGCHRRCWHLESVVVPPWYAGGVEAGSPGSRSAPRETAEGSTNPGGVAESRIFAPRRGSDPNRHAIPRVRASHDPGLSAATPPAYRLRNPAISSRLPGASTRSFP